MCIGRSMYFDPGARPARRAAGPRSIVSDATIADGEDRRHEHQAHADVADSSAERGGRLNSFTELRSAARRPRPTSLRGRGPRRPCRRGRAQLVFHLHRFDDDDRLTRADGVARLAPGRARLCRASARRPLRSRRAGRRAPAAVRRRRRPFGLTATGTDPDRTDQSAVGVRGDRRLVNRAGAGRPAWCAPVLATRPRSCDPPTRVDHDQRQRVRVDARGIDRRTASIDADRKTIAHATRP